MAKKYDYEKLEAEGKTDAHIDGEVIKNLETDMEIDAKYKFRIKNPIGKFFASIFWGLVALLVPFIVLVWHGTRIKGKRNLRNLKNTGAVVVPNHVLYLDCMIAAQCVYPKKLYFHVLEQSMKVKGLNVLMKALGAMPIPTKVSAKKSFIAETNQILKEKKFVCVYPEAALWPYYEKIRPFKSGAFHFAVKNNVPIVPICINFRRRRGLYKKLKIRAKLVTVHIGKPIYANNELEFNDAVTDLMKRANYNMQRMNHWFKVIDKGSADEKERFAMRPLFPRNSESKKIKKENKENKKQIKLNKKQEKLAKKQNKEKPEIHTTEQENNKQN